VDARLQQAMEAVQQHVASGGGAHHTGYTAEGRSMEVDPNCRACQGRHEMHSCARKSSPQITPEAKSPSVQYNEWGGIIKNTAVSVAAASAASPPAASAWHGSVQRSRFRGVSYVQVARKWRCDIAVAGRQKALGRFHDEEAAARAWDVAARQMWTIDTLPMNGGANGRFFNFPTEEEQLQMQRRRDSPNGGVGNTKHQRAKRVRAAAGESAAQVRTPLLVLLLVVRLVVVVVLLLLLLMLLDAARTGAGACFRVPRRANVKVPRRVVAQAGEEHTYIEDPCCAFLT